MLIEWDELHTLWLKEHTNEYESYEDFVEAMTIDLTPYWKHIRLAGAELDTREGMNELGESYECLTLSDGQAQELVEKYIGTPFFALVDEHDLDECFWGAVEDAFERHQGLIANAREVSNDQQ